jgi:hypothetical protein
MSGDDEFDDFLARRKPLFRRPAEELEPPADVDRLVLRQAREAIRPSRELHEIRAPGWGMPLALAATVLVTVTIVLNVMVARKVDNTPSDIHQVAQRVEAAAPIATAPTTNNPAPLAADARQPAAAPIAESAPAWRRDTQSWLAEIDKLRAQGKKAEADAEMAEYKRLHRAYAASPDR